MKPSPSPVVPRQGSSPPSPGPRRQLCAACLESFPESELGADLERRLCSRCRAKTGQTGARPGDAGEGGRPRVAATRAPLDRPSETEEARGLLAEIRAACANRWWEVRVPLLLYFSYLLVRYLGNDEYQSLLKGLNLGIHELGHPLFSLFGQVAEVAGGSLLQCLVPLGAMAMFWKQRDVFAIAVAFAWLGTNLFEVATYAADARTMALPLVTPGGGHALHDWNWLLGRFDLLPHDQDVAFFLRGLAVASFALAHAGGVWILTLMVKGRRKGRPVG